MIYTLRTTVGREKTVMDSLNAKIKAKSYNVKVIMGPGELKGYVFIEGEKDNIKKVIQGLPHIRGFLDKEIKIEELERFFAEKPLEIKLEVGDLVEVIGGPFKREKAKIVRVDEVKREAKIEFIDSAVPIPITIKTDLLKIVKQ